MGETPYSVATGYASFEGQAASTFSFSPVTVTPEPEFLGLGGAVPLILAALLRRYRRA